MGKKEQEWKQHCFRKQYKRKKAIHLRFIDTWEELEKKPVGTERTLKKCALFFQKDLCKACRAC